MGSMPTETNPTITAGQTWSDEFGTFTVVAAGRNFVTIEQFDGPEGLVDIHPRAFRTFTLEEEA